MTSGEILAVVIILAATLSVGVAIGRFLPRKKPVLAPVVPIAEPTFTPSVLQLRAAELTKEQDGVDASGEYKRHIVYAQLIKEFPDETKRNISKAIESAL